MGQCASSDLPPPAGGDSNVDKENSLDESVASEISNNIFRRSRRSSAASWVSNRLQKRQKNKDLSAAFNLLDHDAKSNLVNINLASEEELMTLQGITRILAKKIVEYRSTIGGFRRIEDLALVSGIGASMLEGFKNDVTIKKYHSYSSSRTPSFDSIPSCDSLKSQRSNHSNNMRSLKTSPMKKVNINRASIFDLMNIRGINQEMAANIVHYRSKQGSFRKIDEIVKVRGLNSRMLSVLQIFLTCDDEDSPSTTGTSDSLSITSCGRAVAVPACRVAYRDLKETQKESFSRKFKSWKNKIEVYDTHERCIMHRKCVSRSSLSYPQDNCDTCQTLLTDQEGHRRTQSAPLHTEECSDNSFFSVEPLTTPIQNHCSHRFSSEFAADLFELLSLKSDRPIHKDVFNGSYLGKAAIRIGSWNMQQLTLEKVNNPGVLEVICRTILENGFSLIALQEISNSDVLNKICSELNYGSLRRIREWNGPKGDWKWQVSEEPSYISHCVEYAAFLYNTNHGVRLTSSCLLPIHVNVVNNNSKSSSALLRKPFIGYFKVVDLDFVVVNIHLQTKKIRRNRRISEEESDELIENFKETELYQNEEDKNGIDTLYLSPLISALREKLESASYVVLLGNFNLTPTDPAFQVLKASSYSHVVPDNVSTDISYDKPLGCECLDNIWLSSHSQKLFTKSWGVVREGLSHMAIPRGWGWGGMVSEHCPIYCDLFTEVSTQSQKLTLQNKKPVLNGK